MSEDKKAVEDERNKNELNTAPVDVKENVTAVADHDRVSSLSIAKDGSLDQHDPELIGDKDAILAKTKEQFAQIATSAVDNEHNARKQREEDAKDNQQSKDIAARKAEHDSAVSDAHSKAENVVNELHKGAGDNS